MTAESETVEDVKRKLHTARRLARTAMEVMTDDQLAEVRQRMDEQEDSALAGKQPV